MATKIITRTQKIDMANQLRALGATIEESETGTVAKTPKGKEVFRAMAGTGGDFLARWPDGLFDAV